MAGDAAPVVNALKKLSILPGGHSLHWVASPFCWARSSA